MTAIARLGDESSSIGECPLDDIGVLFRSAKERELAHRVVRLTTRVTDTAIVPIYRDYCSSRNSLRAREVCR